MTVVLQAKADTFLRNIKSAEQTFIGSLDRIKNEADQDGSTLAIQIALLGAGTIIALLGRFQDL
ncbi:hypothetical protein [Chelativorans sp. M5D2P16]|uniref:hypothetical protein n=1 Tax=Chelativorans sp. M5D2P16 TaxID=3095678 RepID=UPI002ACA4652|nr:hypothetical protein [Chelativorans sp. M5D2P16]MDZ5697636.1 hypothetical protein [Chelativorans sp. M5D2P16]